MNPILDEARYWRSKSGAEVDFILESGGEISAFEVKPTLPRARISKSTRSFIEAYRPARFYYVTDQTHADLELDNTIIRFIHYKNIGSVIQYEKKVF